MKLVIVVPCYNEEEVLAETTRQLSSVVDELLSDGKIDEGKILYVDDGSRDRTWELIRGFSETHPSVTGLKLAHNVGHQQALWAGLEWAASHADAAVSIDADLQDDVRSIVGMVDAWRGGAGKRSGAQSRRASCFSFGPFGYAGIVTASASAPRSPDFVRRARGRYGG